MKITKKAIILTAIYALAAIILVGAIIYRNGSLNSSQSGNADVDVPKLPEISGTVACLPLKSGEPTDDKTCVKGIRNDQGLYLELKNKSQDTLTVGNNITVNGSFTPPAEDSTFSVSGLVTVE